MSNYFYLILILLFAACQKEKCNETTEHSIEPYRKAQLNRQENLLLGTWYLDSFVFFDKNFFKYTNNKLDTTTWFNKYTFTDTLMISNYKSMRFQHNESEPSEYLLWKVENNQLLTNNDIRFINSDSILSLNEREMILYRDGGNFEQWDYYYKL